MSGLHHLITMHKATMAVYKAVPDDEWGDVADQVSATIEASRAEIINYRPQNIEDAWEKAQFMLSCRSFTEWGDIDIKDVINGFTRGLA